MSQALEYIKAKGLLEDYEQWLSNDYTDEVEE